MPLDLEQILGIWPSQRQRFFPPGPKLWPKLINSETTGSFFAHGLEDNTYSDLQLTGVLIYDTATGNFVSNQDIFPLILRVAAGSGFGIISRDTSDGNFRRSSSGVDR